MDNFEFYTPTKIFFGDDREKDVGKIIATYGFKKIALVYGKGSIKKIGLYDTVINSLKENNIDFIELSGVEANPKLSLVIKMKEILKNNPAEMILAVGGGSVIDTCKSLSHAYYYENNPFDFNLGICKSTQHLPVGVILTISAAGSEMSSSCVISNDLITPYRKKGFNADSNRPLFAILNPKLTYSVSPYQTACGIVDIMMHTLERYMNANDNCKLADAFAISLLKTVIENGKIVMKDSTNYNARKEIMLASSFSHNGLTSLGKTTFMRVHGFEHILSGMYDSVAHGAGLAILWPCWCEYILDNPAAKEKLTILAKELFHVNDAETGIIKLKDFFKELNMPTSFKDLGFEVDVESLALEYVKYNKTTTNDYKILDINAAKEIFSLANN